MENFKYYSIKITPNKKSKISEQFIVYLQIVG